MVGLYRRGWWAYLVLAAAGTPVYFLVVHGEAQKILFYGYGLSSVAAVVAGIRFHTPDRPWPWRLFAAGLLLFALGDIAFDIYAHAGHTPVPSAADALYLGAYPVLAVGLVLLVRYRSPGSDVLSVLDGATVAVAAGAITWVFIIDRYIHQSSTSILHRAVLITYPVLDIVLVAVLARFLLTRIDRSAGFVLLSGSLVALLAADWFYTFAQLNNTYVDGSVIDLGYIASYAMWGAAALHPSMSALSEPAGTMRARARKRGIVVLGCAALVPPLLIVVQEVRHRGIGIPFLAVASGVTIVAVTIRFSLMTGALNRSYRTLSAVSERHRVLADSAVALLRATDPDEIFDSMAKASAALAGGESAYACLATFENDTLIVASSAGNTALRSRDWAQHLFDLNVEEIRSRRWPYVVTGSDADVLELMSGGTWKRFFAQIATGERLRGAILVEGPVDDPEEFVSNLEILCSQADLALQSADTATERAKQRHEQLFASLVTHSTDVVTLVSADLVVRFQSPSAAKVFGIDAADIVGTSITAYVHPADLEQVEAELSAVVGTGFGSTRRIECRVAHGSGGWRVVESTATNLLGDPDVLAVVLNSRDITERRTLEEQLHRQAFTDALTGLPNRALFMDRCANALRRGKLQGYDVALLCLDVDDFQVVNDSLGHRAGDELLVLLAERLSGLTGAGDTVAHLGGDEFAVLLEYGFMPDFAVEIADRIGEALRAPVTIGETTVPVATSIGIAFSAAGETDAETLLRNADLAVFMAKRNGKGRAQIFQPEMHDQAVARLTVAAELRRALDNGELEVFYQPIVAVGTATIIGAEALVRWRHPDRGLVPPFEFIPVAEATGLIVPLGEWVLAESCRQLREWRREHLVSSTFYVSVNVSAVQLQREDVAEKLSAIIERSRAGFSAVVLEVTESCFIDDMASSLGRLELLKERGLQLALDDFGTGYSSLNHLRSFPMDVVKIDKSFIDRIADNGEGTQLVRTIIDMARSLGLKVVAEGIEEEQQLDVLVSMECDSYQGYYFAKPMPAPEMTELLLRTEGSSRSVFENA